MAQVQRAEIIQEVLELGESLFELALAGQQQPRQGSTQADNAEDSQPEEWPEGELRAGADEFFRALRLLLGVTQA